MPIRPTPVVLRQTVWGRLTMAAAVGMAFVVAAIFMQVPMQAQSKTHMAGALPAEVEQILFEPTSNRDGDVWYLLDTRDVTFEDLMGDLERLTEELEM